MIDVADLPDETQTLIVSMRERIAQLEAVVEAVRDWCEKNWPSHVRAADEVLNILEQKETR